MYDHKPPVAAAPPLIDPATLIDDPHAQFAVLRRDHAVIQTGERQYTVLRAHDVLALPKDPRTVQIEGPDYVALNRIPDGHAARFLGDFFLFANGEAHRARRGLFARSFAHGAMRAARPRIRAVADAIVADLPRGAEFDFVAGMAARVPAEMIAGLLGLPRAEAPVFAAQVYEVARALTPVYPHDDHDAIEAAAAALFAYLSSHMRARLTAPRDDLLTALVADWQENDNREIPFESLVNQVLGIVLGGSDTTRAAFAMLVALLLRHPADWQALRADPALIPGAVAEGLRYDPSVGSFPRFTTAPVEIGGVTVPAGVMLGLSTLSAMRDPALYRDPDRFDIRRTDHPRLHLVFGLGAHRCIGEMLARIEMEEGLAALLDGAAGIAMAETPRFIGFGGIRQITPMPVRIG